MKNKFLPIMGMLLCLAFQTNAQTYNLHWGGAIWGTTPAAFPFPSYDDTAYNLAGSGVNVIVEIKNRNGATVNNSSVAANTPTNSTAFQNNTPKVGAALSAWFLPGSTGSNPLAMLVDWNDLASTVTTRIIFSQPVKDVQFYLGDMDRAATVTYVDRFTFTAKNNGVAVANPVVTKFQPTVTGGDTVLINGNSAYGNSATGNSYNAATNSITTQGATIFVQIGRAHV